VKKAEQYLNQARAERAEYQAQRQQDKEAAEKVGLFQMEQPWNAAADCTHDFVSHNSFTLCHKCTSHQTLNSRTHLLQNSKEQWRFGVMMEKLPHTDGSFLDR